MIPCCWIVFHYEDLFPREGHILWVAAMLLMLFSSTLPMRSDLKSALPAIPPP
jgi:hypothetical protein